MRLAPKLANLVSPVQNTFISSQSLDDNFILVQQSAHLLHQFGASRVLLNLDLARAFDSLSWPFLFEVLRQFSFSNKLLKWLAILLSSASTKVLMNGETGPPIWHKGLRHGDPLSLHLFILIVDVLGRPIHRSVESRILQQFHPRHVVPPISLYADGGVILSCHPPWTRSWRLKES
jgi:hypothetical protein